MSISNLFVMSSAAAVSFCYYRAREAGGATLTPQTLRAAIDRAEHEAWSLTLMLGPEPLEAPLADVVSEVPHARIAPLGHPDLRPGDLAVMGPDDAELLPDSPDGAGTNAVLRLPRERLGDLATILKSCEGSVRRLGLILLDLPAYGEAEYREYRRQLDRAAGWLGGRFARNEAVELGFLTDRLMLTSMNNCDPGTKHVTMAADGRLYLCPGFYLDDPDESIGTIDGEIAIPGERLLRLENAPICRICDAWHCRRCLWLNRTTTLEINTPSAEQCTVSHLERAQSRALLESLRERVEFRSLPEIPELDYLDPLGELQRRMSAREPMVPPRPAPRPERAPFGARDAKSVRRLEPLVPAAWKKEGNGGANTAELMMQLLENQRRILAYLERMSQPKWGETTTTGGAADGRER